MIVKLATYEAGNGVKMQQRKRFWEHEASCPLQAASHYQNAVDLDLTGTAARAELASVHTVRKHLAEGNAVLDSDPRQAQWYADLAARQLSPTLLEPAHMLRCKVGSCQQGVK